MAHDFGQTLSLHGVVAIHGAMGVGKTTMVRRLLEVWNVKEEGASPTFGLCTTTPSTEAPVRSRCDMELYGWKTKRRQNAQALQRC